MSPFERGREGKAHENRERRKTPRTRSWRFRERLAPSRFTATFRFATSGAGTPQHRARDACATSPPGRGTRTMPKKDKAKQQVKDARGAVTEEVSKTVHDAEHAAGGVATSLKDAVASGVDTVAETTTHAMSSVSHAVSSAIEKVRLALPRARAVPAALPPSTLTRAPHSRVLGTTAATTFSCRRGTRRYDFRAPSTSDRPAGHGGAGREQRREGRRARRRRGQPTMRAC